MDFLNLQLNGKTAKRFDMMRYMAFREGYYDAVSSYFLQEARMLPAIGLYKITDVPFRPDMISFDLYGDTQYWWLVMLYNDEIFLEKLTQGRKLSYFALGDLDRLFYSATRLALPNPQGKP